MKPVEVLYDDARVVVCVKPAGITSEAGGVIRALCGSYGFLHCVHRLDRETSGVMVYARDASTAARLSEDFAERRVAKVYLAAVHGEPEAPEGALRDLLFHDSRSNKTFVVTRPRKNVKEASLEYRTLAVADGLSLLRVRLGTGRSHQIRAQFASRQHPVYGDRRYGAPEQTPLGLLACSLTFTHPSTGKTMTFTVPTPSGAPWDAFPAKTLEDAVRGNI